jgi:hypothetical protein
VLNRVAAPMRAARRMACGMRRSGPGLSAAYCAVLAEAVTGAEEGAGGITLNAIQLLGGLPAALLGPGWCRMGARLCSRALALDQPRVPGRAWRVQNGSPELRAGAVAAGICGNPDAE